MKYFFVCFLVTGYLCSCQNSPERATETTATPAVSAEDSLYRQTMAIHNEVMAKMGKLMAYEKQAQKQSDSIKAQLSHTTFPTEIARRIASDVNTLDSLSNQLKAADKAMNDWMEQFDGDPKMPTTEERAAYFADQKEKATAMRNQFFEAFQQAEKFFSTNK